MMAAASSSTNSPSILKVVIFLILLLTYLPSKPADGSSAFSRHDRESVKEREKLLGSSPPYCVSKCFSCKPCVATLVIPSPPDQWKPFRTRTRPSATSSDHKEKEGNDSYYLLSWKCKCGNKLFHP